VKKLTHSASGRRWLATAAGVAAGVYGAYVGATWAGYGRPARPSPDEEDPLLDHFMPRYDVVERHRVRVDAPAATALEVASHLDLFDLPAVRAIFKGRELLLGSAPGERPAARGMLEAVQALGWVVLADDPGREVVLGAVTKPWEANPTFRSVPPDDFRAFAEPDYVKIAWTLRADPAGRGASVFRTETRAVATDASARARFRVYWSLLSPGIFLIRWLSLGPVKARAERQARRLAAT
jgi:hypothetical protein